MPDSCFSQGLPKHIEEYMDAKYVSKDSCNEYRAATAKKFANDDTRLQLFEHDMKSLKRFLWIITSAVVTSSVAAIFNLIVELAKK